MSPRPDLVVLIAWMAAHSLLAPPAGAQGEPARWTRAEARRQALDRSTELGRRRSAHVEAGRLARVPWLHPLELEVEFEGEPGPWSNRDYTRSVRVAQELDLRGERGARARVGRATRAVLDLELGARTQEIAAEVDLAYSRQLLARRRVALLEPLRDRARDLRARAERARQRETLTGFDARLLRSEALALESDWLDARRELEIAEGELRGWLALPRGTPIELADDLDERPWACDPDSSWELARRSRLDLARAAAAESLALARVELERRLGRSNVALGVTAGRERFELELGPGGATIEDQGTFVGVDLRVGLPFGAPNAAGVGEALVELERARVERAALERELRQRVETACLALGSAEAVRALRREAAAEAGQDLERVESSYEGGRIGLEEYLTLRERLVRHQLSLVDAAATVEEGRARLRSATGALRWDPANGREEAP